MVQVRILAAERQVTTLSQVDIRDLVTGHYGATEDLAVGILRALSGAGVDTDHLGVADLFAVDQLHAGGAAASKHVLDRLGVAPGTRLLDVGCGIGGASRMAAMAGAAVTGIDLTPEYVETARTLSDRVGLGDRTAFVTTAGESMPLDDATFDAAVMVHVGMNVPAKTAVFAEVHRVLRPGGRFAVYEQVRTGEGDLPYPLPWAEDERSSFVETVADYRAHLEAAGFEIEDAEDRTPTTLGPPPQGPISNAVVFGPPFMRRIANNVAATKAGLLGAWLVLARA
ncbi:MAG: arsenite methyltransferase [Pseudonocardiales bacterium]|nr:arsenite methyltransferase [Pseudonocardiales bacterium]